MDRDLRLLDLTEKHWAQANEHIVPLAVPKESFNMVKKKTATPMEDLQPAKV